MFVTLANSQAGNPQTEGILLSHGIRPTGAKAPPPKPKPATAPRAPRRRQTRSVAETAVDLPVGAVLSVTDRVSELVEPFTDRSAAEKQLKSYRDRAAPAPEAHRASRHHRPSNATTEARKTRNRVEREARKRQRTVETTLKRNRNEVEQRVRKAVDDLLPQV